MPQNMVTTLEPPNLCLRYAFYTRWYRDVVAVVLASLHIFKAPGSSFHVVGVSQPHTTTVSGLSVAQSLTLVVERLVCTLSG